MSSKSNDSTETEQISGDEYLQGQTLQMNVANLQLEASDTHTNIKGYCLETTMSLEDTDSHRSIYMNIIEQ